MDGGSRDTSAESSGRSPILPVGLVLVAGVGKDRRKDRTVREQFGQATRGDFTREAVLLTGLVRREEKDSGGSHTQFSYRRVKVVMSETDLAPRGLVIIARDELGRVITRLCCTRSRDVMSAMKSARSVLILKSGAVRVEIHYQEARTSTYPGKPLAVISMDDLISVQHDVP